MSDEVKNPALEALGALGAAMLEGIRPEITSQVEAALKERAKALGVTRIEIVGPEGVKRIEGHVHPVFERVLKNVNAGENVMLVGPAGSGKTTLAAQVAKALSLKFYAQSISEGTTEGSLFGRLLPVGEAGKFAFCPAPYLSFYEEGGLFLLDEADAGNANVFTSLNASLAGGYFFSDLRAATGGKAFVKKHEQFRCIAACNTFGQGGSLMYAGRNQLDAATLDRFKIIEVGYDTSYEQKIARKSVVDWVWGVREKIERHNMRRVASTRMIQRFERALEIGESWSDAKTSLLAGWSKDDLVRIGEA
jgi:cobaltochelatase CobS